jgi:protein-disulfide isomerase
LYKFFSPLPLRPSAPLLATTQSLCGKALGLNISQFLQDMYKHVHLERINQDIESGTHSGVTATPALFINGIRYTNRWNLKELIAAIVTASH